jgi:hypothetical protein
MAGKENVDGITSNNGWSNITVMGYMGILNPADTTLGRDLLRRDPRRLLYILSI